MPIVYWIASGLVRHLLKEKQVIDVNEVVVRVLSILKGELQRNNVTSLTELAPNLPPVPGHEGQMQEVIINLAQNAIDAMRSTPDMDRVLRIKTNIMVATKLSSR